MQAVVVCLGLCKAKQRRWPGGFGRLDPIVCAGLRHPQLIPPSRRACCVGTGVDPRVAFVIAGNPHECGDRARRRPPRAAGNRDDARRVGGRSLGTSGALVVRVDASPESVAVEWSLRPAADVRRKVAAVHAVELLEGQHVRPHSECRGDRRCRSRPPSRATPPSTSTPCSKMEHRPRSSADR